MPVEDSLLDLRIETKFDSKIEYLFAQISREFHFFLWLLFSIAAYFFLKSRILKDYFPFSTQLKESGIHAKLNYQIIADRMSRKLTVLLSFIILFSIIFIFTIFKFSSELDLIIHDDDIKAYETWISAIEGHVGKDEKNSSSSSEKLYEFVETNTEMFWTVYFIRYITVRLFIAFLVGTLITFLIKLYLRTKTDRSLIIQKEEALSAIHYLARGEWRYQYDLNGNLLFESIEGRKGERRIITEAELTEIEQQNRSQYRPLTLDILKNSRDKAAHINTKDLLEYIPIKELFSSTTYTNSRRTNNKSALDDYSLNLESVKKQLAEISNELKNMVIISNRKDGDIPKD